MTPGHCTCGTNDMQPLMDQFSHFTVRFCSCLSREIFFIDLYKFSLNFFANAVICMLYAGLIALSSLLFTGDDIFSVLGNIYRRLMNVFTFGNLCCLLYVVLPSRQRRHVRRVFISIRFPCFYLSICFNRVRLQPTN